MIWGAEQLTAARLQLQPEQLCASIGGPPKSLSGVSPRGHWGFGPPSSDTMTIASASQSGGTASTHAAPEPHGFTTPVPVDDELLLMSPPPPLAEVVVGLPPSPPAVVLLPAPPPVPVSSNVNGVGTHAAKGPSAPSDAIARRLARSGKTDLLEGAWRRASALLWAWAWAWVGPAIGIGGEVSQRFGHVTI